MMLPLEWGMNTRHIGLKQQRVASQASADRMAMGNTANAIAAATSNAKKVCIVIIYTDYWVKYLKNRLWREDTRSFVNSKSLVSILSPLHTSLLTIHLKAEIMSWSWLVMS